MQKVEKKQRTKKKKKKKPSTQNSTKLNTSKNQEKHGQKAPNTHPKRKDNIRQIETRGKRRKLTHHDTSDEKGGEIT